MLAGDVGAVRASAVDAAMSASLATFPRPPRSQQLEELATALGGGASYDAVASIYSQGAQLAAAGPHARAKRDAAAIAERFRREVSSTPATTSSSPSTALDALSAETRVPAALLLRRIIECPPFNVPRGSVTEFMRAPRASAATRAAAEGGERTTTTALLAAAADAAAAASASDPLYSPRGDALRHVAGLEAEALLCARLRSAGGGGEGGADDDGRGERSDDDGRGERADDDRPADGDGESRGVPFWTEEALRAGGFALTPDVRLATPVALPCGHVVHWVDSKATFGTVRMHEHYLEEQYARYTNRYGSGLVIYWSGFDERLLPPPTPAPTTAGGEEAEAARSTQRHHPSSAVRQRWRAGVAIAATLPAALKGLRTLPRLRLPARATQVE